MANKIQQTVQEIKSDIYMYLMKEDISKQDVTQNHLNNELGECKQQNKHSKKGCWS